MNQKIELSFVSLKQCKSTNDELYLLAKSGAPKGTVVTARFQTGGRGTNGRSFHSPEETGIYMSVLLREISNERMLDITPLAAVAVSKTLDELCGVHTMIKPVNDIYLNRKKVCGILTQAETTGKKVNFIIVGIGINLFKPKKGFPTEIENIAGYVLESFDEQKKHEVIEKAALLLLEGGEKIEYESFRKEMYDYYNSRRFEF